MNLQVIKICQSIIVELKNCWIEHGLQCVAESSSTREYSDVGSSQSLQAGNGG